MQESVEAAERHLRDEAALEGALARPGFRVHYENASLYGDTEPTGRERGSRAPGARRGSSADALHRKPT
jgi:hypothetical protein